MREIHHCRSARAFFDEKEFEPSVRFYVLYEQLVSAMTDFGKIEVSKIEQILIYIEMLFVYLSLKITLTKDLQNLLFLLIAFIYHF